MYMLHFLALLFLTFEAYICLPAGGATTSSLLFAICSATLYPSNRCLPMSHRVRLAALIRSFTAASKSRCVNVTQCRWRTAWESNPGDNREIFETEHGQTRCDHNFIAYVTLRGHSGLQATMDDGRLLSFPYWHRRISQQGHKLLESGGIMAATTLTQGRLRFPASNMSPGSSW
jgi:hypothetical protein